MTGRPRLENPRRLPRHLRNEDIPSNTFTPRAYQVELLDSAIKRNSIICLGSSTGKTFIAVMVLRELSHQVRPPLTQNGKRSVFLVNNESHLSEKAKIIEHHTDLNIGSYTTEQNTDDWSSEKWGQEINSKHILVTTPKIFYSLLAHGHLNCPQLNVVVFEDCHLATSDEFHNKILDYLHSKCLDPLLLEKSVVSLEEKLKCTAETSSLVISERYGIKPKEIIFECDNYEDTTGMVESLGDILERSFEFLQECNILLDEDKDDDDRDPTQIPKTAISECLNILYKLGPWCAAHIAQMLVTQIEKIDKHERVSIHKTFLKYCATQLRLISTMFEQDFKPDYDVEELLTYTTPKVRKLINHLRKFKPNCDFMIISSEEMDDEELDDMDNDSFMSDDSDFIDTDDDEHDEKSRSPKLIHIAVKKENEETEVNKKTFDPLFTEDNPYLCGIVFVDHRYVALALNKFIEEVCSWDEQLCFIKSQQISAHSQKGSAAKKEGGKIYKKQEEILRKFRLQEINLLISTNVLEDGIDLPKCNLVVKFDSPKDYRSYCQSKGRARARDAEYVLMVEEYALESFRKDIQMYKGIEQILIGRGRAKDDTDDDIGIYISEEEEHKYEDILPPYSAGEGCPSVSLSNSLALINRYCAKLPSDAFTHLTPHCTIQQISQDGNPMYIAKLRLPINSPIKNELQGIPMPSKTLAKKAVALKMCEMLHKAGELDEQLMPVGKELFILEEEDNTEWSEEDVSGEARPGTTKRKQYYVKKIASALLQSHPKIKNNLIYILNLKLTKPISDDQNTRGRKIYDPEENNSTFGLVTCNEIPQIPQFPVYTRSGEVTVSISLLKENVEFTEEELSKFQRFP
ncbi:hypothetical protein KUTeg_013644 [Tegillarca granosa]|uniref:Uncharacterized protein n=1 Tax=Tegillarca granosa TaxID=220873 RepID=A0ABQ9EY61_TEGGR|nr:hypothetical protein KUTeg_013644 [Tegillarca granosa]